MLSRDSHRACRWLHGSRRDTPWGLPRDVARAAWLGVLVLATLTPHLAWRVAWRVVLTTFTPRLRGAFHCGLNSLAGCAAPHARVQWSS